MPTQDFAKKGRSIVRKYSNRPIKTMIKRTSTCSNQLSDCFCLVLSALAINCSFRNRSSAFHPLQIACQDFLSYTTAINCFWIVTDYACFVFSGYIYSRLFLFYRETFKDMSLRYYQVANICTDRKYQHILADS